MRSRPVSTDTALYVSILDLCPPGGTVLDVGAGKAKYHGMLAQRAGHMTLVDAYEPYLADRRAALPADKVETLCACAENALPFALSREDYDVALAIDFVEHLDKPMALMVIEHMKRVAKTVAVFTPRGFHPQDHDYLNEGADHWQTHRSAWQPEEFDALGFDTEVWTGFHEWARERYKDYPDFCPDALWAVWRR